MQLNPSKIITIKFESRNYSRKRFRYVLLQLSTLNKIYGNYRLKYS